MGGRQKALGVGQEDVEDAVVHDPPQLLRDGVKQLVRVEHGVDLADEGQQVGEELPGQRRARLDAGGLGHGAC